MIRPSRSIRRHTRLIIALSVVVACFVQLAFVSSAIAAETTFAFMSRGFGHGIGMSQYGAKGFAEHGSSYSTILRYYYGNAGTDSQTAISTFASEPTRDVLLDKAASSSNSGYTRATWTIRPGNVGSQLAVKYGSSTTPVFYCGDGTSTFTADGSDIVMHDSAGKSWRFSGTIVVWGVSGSPQLTQVVEPTGNYGLEYVRFRGTLRLTAQDDKLKLVNRLDMSDYLYGVVPREMPASWASEALKAQAVAARSYSWTSTRAELYTTTSDQVYGGHSRGEVRSNPTMHEDSRSNAAVDATVGRCVTYGGSSTDKIIRTYFMSTSGGHTENNEDVWSGSALPHLRGVPDPYEVYAGSSRHSWTYQSFTASEVRQKLLSAGASPSLVPDPIAAIKVVERGVSGRPTKIEFTSTTGTKTYFDSYSEILAFRNGLGWGDHWFYVNYKTSRIAGSDRYETSVEASKRVFGTSNPAKAVIIASGAAPADALAASSLAGAVGGAPILLVGKNSIPGTVSTEISRLGVSKIYIAGGEAVVSDAVAEALDDLPGIASVERLAGADRYGTACQIALKVEALVGPSRVIVVSGESLADAVAASGWAYAKSMPIIPVKVSQIPPASQQALDAIAPSSSMVVGGTGVVSDAVLADLPGGRRIVAGADRYESARMLSWHLVNYEGFSYSKVYISSGTSLIDALAIGPVNGHNDNPLLFSKSYDLRSPTRLQLIADKSRIQHVYVVGGEAALSGLVQGQIEETLE